MTTQQDSTTRELEAALHGLDYPAPRATLLSVAHLNGASPEALRRILLMSSRSFPVHRARLSEAELDRGDPLNVLRSATDDVLSRLVRGEVTRGAALAAARSRPP